MALRGESESQPSDLEVSLVRDQAPARFCTLCIDRKVCCALGLGIIVFIAFFFIGASIFRRDLILLAVAAWSFIVVLPLLQVLQQRLDPVLRQVCCESCTCIFASEDDTEKEVKYELSGKVVKEKKREELKATGSDLFEIDMEKFEIKSNVETWYRDNRDADWYRAGRFSFGFAIAKAMLNIYSIMISPIHYKLLILESDEPGWLGSTWVVSIEIPYMFLFLLPYFCCTALQLRGWCTDSEGKSNAVVRLSGLLKSLGRFSALNLLEFVRIDDFIQQYKMQKAMSIIGAVIGFMAFRCKVTEIAFVVNHHTLAWTSGQWIRVLALINNLLSITDNRGKMIFAAIQTKDYRKDRWLEAVGDHLWSELNCGSFHVLKRLVSLGPDDVNRLIEDLGIDHKSQSGSYQKQNIPKQILDDCWNWQFTNIVGVVRFGLFRVLAENETVPHQNPERPPQQGKMKRTEEEQHLVQKKKLEALIADHNEKQETAKKDRARKRKEEIQANREVADILQREEYEAKLQELRNQIDALQVQEADYNRAMSDLRGRLTVAVNEKEDAEAKKKDAEAKVKGLQDQLTTVSTSNTSNEQLIQQLLSQMEQMGTSRR